MNIFILGNGISGVSCARYLRKLSDHDITLVSDEADEFFSRTALMYIFMGHLREQDTRPYPSDFWEKNHISRVRATIQRVDFQEKKLFSTDGRAWPYDVLVLATGSLPNRYGWPGQDLAGVQGLYHLQDLEKMNLHTSGLEQGKAVVVGGGLIGIEMVEMLHARHIPVTFLIREKDFFSNVLPAAEAAMISRHLREHHIDLRLQTELSEIVPDATGEKCDAVVTKTGDIIACQFVGITVGVSPNISFLKDTALEVNKGILSDNYLRTNLPGVYAAGDCVELRHPPPGRRPVEAIWYTGRMMGETVAYNILADHPQPAQPRTSLRHVEYRPGIWFNSAKFLDIEYQVYGDIKPQLPEHQCTLYWEHPGGKKSIRINYLRDSGAVVGFNLMGVRYRHEVCEQWIRDETHIEAVLQRLGLANFDPEFFPQHEHALVALYNQQTGRHLTLKQKRGLPAVLRFLQGQ